MTPLNFLVHFVILLLCRAFDLYTTWGITPDLKYELNPVMRWLGWKWGIIFNFHLCALLAALHNSEFVGWIYYLLCIGSIGAGCWNLRLIWRVAHRQ